MSDLKKRAAEVNKRLAKKYPDAKCSLDFTNAFELLIATILAAQSTDARVNIVTKSLFRKYPNPQAFANASQVEMETDVKQTGFFRNKAKAVIACGTAIVEKHGGEVPRTMEELVALPGVGRKTANVILGNAFQMPVGVVVDTHMSRVAGRLGLTQNTDPVKIEEDVTPLLPKSEITAFAHRVIYHGREICVARKPLCPECVLNDICPSADLNPERAQRAKDQLSSKEKVAAKPSEPNPERAKRTKDQLSTKENVAAKPRVARSRVSK